jgi:hypothetical protein
VGNSLEPRSAAEPSEAGVGSGAGGGEAKSSGVHSASTHVTIAWPFSQIKLQEASAELSELAALLSDLVDALSGLVAEDRLAPLRERTEALLARLR